MPPHHVTVDGLAVCPVCGSAAVSHDAAIPQGGDRPVLAAVLHCEQGHVFGLRVFIHGAQVGIDTVYLTDPLPPSN
ncbi:MAG TPA: hypothetical protein VII06_43135 [Chloroflexota bacterium]|jgi:hypothetical protein